MLYLKLAWRNIWRNKRRSLITIASILFAVFFAIFLRSMQLGMYDKMIDSVVRSWYGYIQIHANGYWDEQSLENSFERDTSLEKQLLENKNVLHSVPRIEGFALLSVGEKVRGIHLAGIDPESEDALSGLKNRIISGSYLNATGNEIIIAEGLARQLEIKTGDTLAMISQGYNAVTASGKFVVKGIVKLISTQMNNGSSFVPLSAAQEFYGAQNRLTSIALQLKSGSFTNKTLNDIRKTLDTETYEIMAWQEMLPELVQMIQADSSGGEIMVFILYMVISFGLFGTVLMMLTERKYEFGVLLSVGMSRLRLSIVLILESFLISLIGVTCGILVSRPFMFYFNTNPITLSGKAAETLRKFGFEPVMPTLLDYSIPLTHGLAVLSIAFLISLYSIFSIYRLDPVKAAKR